MRSRWLAGAEIAGLALALTGPGSGQLADARPPVGGASAPGDAAAPPGALVVPLGSDARVDWTRGLLIATGAAAGDLRAPSPEVARVKAERQARDAARARLEKLARDLALADGKKLGGALGGEASARLDRALAHLVDQRIQHASDGSVVLEAALPLEAARAAVFGAGEPAAPGSEKLPTAIVIEAGRHMKRPALGVKLTAGSEKYAGPTVFAEREAAVGREALGPRPVRVRATGFRGGALQLDDGDASKVKEAREAGALVVVELPAAHGDAGRDRDPDERDRKRDRKARAKDKEKNR